MGTAVNISVRLKTTGLSLVMISVFATCGFGLTQGQLPQPPSDPKTIPRSQYKIQLRLNLDSRSYSGQQRVRWVNRGERSTASLYFHLYANLRSSLQSNSAVPTGPPVTDDEPRIEILEVRSVVGNERLPFYLDDQDTTLRVNLKESVQPGESAEVIVTFKGDVPEIDPEETSITTHVIKQVSAALRNEREVRRARDLNFRCRGLMLLGTPYPVLAVYEGDDWQRKIESTVGDFIFNEVADYEVQVETAAGVMVFTSGTEQPQNALSEIKTYKGSSLRDFAIIAGRGLSVEESVVGNTTLRSIFLPQHERTGKRVLTAGTNALRIFNSRFGPPPFQTINIVEAPLVAGLGSTEFAGLNVIASAFYIDFDSAAMRNLPSIIREQRPSVEQSLEWTVGHLVAHQWWGAAVGNNPAREPVLDEALSYWAALLYYREAYGEKEAATVLDDQLLGVYRVYRTFGGEDMDANRAARDYRNSFQYAAIVATKGAMMFVELERLLGSEKFFAALRSYYKANLFEIAELDDLRGAFIAEAPIEQRRTVARTFSRWLSSKRGDEDIAKPDPELAKSLGLEANPGKEKGNDRNALNAFARVGKFFWQQMTRIR
ncbi:MAG TPA: M1 family aminopeptidase [Pyrinomonadaceae bacterium]|nr:M1 family aminopeptidase [Pyrinomonadaceae bacterium]